MPVVTLPDLRLFDCFARVGNSIVPPYKKALVPEDLLDEMDFCGVDEALVHNDAAEVYDPAVANPDISAFCATNSRLHPVWSILPTSTSEMDANSLFDEMKKNGVKVLEARPRRHRYLLNALTMGELLEPIMEQRIPLFLEPAWETITEVLKQFPYLTVIVQDTGAWGSDRFFRPLLDHFERIFLDISSMELDGGIPELVKRYGPERLLFGSGFHRRPMGGAVTQLRNLDINRRAKNLMAHGNIERLLCEVCL